MLRVDILEMCGAMMGTCSIFKSGDEPTTLVDWLFGKRDRRVRKICSRDEEECKKIFCIRIRGSTARFDTSHASEIRYCATFRKWLNRAMK
jgi:hypothetical protein